MDFIRTRMISGGGTERGTRGTQHYAQRTD